MAEPGVIAEYVERLARELDFDPSLSRCVRREVEDHLREAVSADVASDRLEAERRAVANFGDPRAIAAQFVVASLAKQARRLSIGAVVMIFAVFVAMRARLTWYAVMEHPTSQIGPFGPIVVSIDRYAFWLAVLTGIAGWLYIGRRRIPTGLTPLYQAQMRRFSLLCLAATGALIVSVISDGVLTGLRLAGTAWSPAGLIPLFTMAIELSCAAGLVVSLHVMARRTAATIRATRIEEGG